MTTTQALVINTVAINKNLDSQSKDNGKANFEWRTPESFDGFGLTKDINDPNSVAYFFAQYASDINQAAPYSNIRLHESTGIWDNEGYLTLVSDVIERAGEDKILSQDELQTWADEVGYTGDIIDIMTALEEVDKYICGENTMKIETVDLQEPQEVEETTEETTEETEPDNDGESLGDTVGGAIGGVIDGVVGYIGGIANSTIDLFKSIFGLN